jgi:long-chain acyl-CoA synthetase
MIVGQSRNFVTMLISLDEDAITAWAAGGTLDGRSYEEICAARETEKMVAEYVEELNAKLNRWETIKKFTILPRDLSIEAGEITPSMKIKRRNVEANFADQIDKMYEGTLAQL